MARETKEAKRVRAVRVVAALDAAIPEARIALRYEGELQLLVAVMLSAQCTDAVVNTVTPDLFARYPTAADYARAAPEELMLLIRRVGLFRTKAKNLHAAMRILSERHGGSLPRDRDALRELPGVGWKTAGVVVHHAFGMPALPVDTHVGRVSRRLGLTRQVDPDKVERELSALLPKARWGRAHQLFIWHGRRTCIARKPLCSRCPVADLCPRAGVKGAG